MFRAIAIWRHGKGPNSFKFNVESDGSLSMARQIGLKSRDFPREWCELGVICWHWRGLNIRNFCFQNAERKKINECVRGFDLLESIRLPSIWWYDDTFGPQTAFCLKTDMKSKFEVKKQTDSISADMMMHTRENHWIILNRIVIWCDFESLFFYCLRMCLRCFAILQCLNLNGVLALINSRFTLILRWLE